METRISPKLLDSSDLSVGDLSRAMFIEGRACWCTPERRICQRMSRSRSFWLPPRALMGWGYGSNCGNLACLFDRRSMRGSEMGERGDYGAISLAHSSVVSAKGLCQRPTVLSSPMPNLWERPCQGIDREEMASHPRRSSEPRFFG